MEIYLLTKPPLSIRAKLCFELMERSSDVHLYLAGDGVYCLLEGLDLLPANRIFACQEDAEARGVRGEGTIEIILECFYDRLVEDLMEHAAKVYTF